MIFENRVDAGRQLAGRLLRYRGEDPVVLGLPRGGVPVGYEVAKALDCPLDVEVARKLGAPGNPEFGFGAVGASGVRILNQEVVDALGISPDLIDQIAAREAVEVERRLAHYRQGLPPIDVAAKTAILVDDGLATGVTARAAIEDVRLRNPRRLVLAVPVGAPETVDALSREVDDLVCLTTPANFMAVGYWYRDFGQTSDEEVTELLARSRKGLMVRRGETRGPGGMG